MGLRDEDRSSYYPAGQLKGVKVLIVLHFSHRSLSGVDLMVPHLDLQEAGSGNHAFGHYLDS